MGITYASKPKQPFEEIQDYIEFSGRLAAGDTIASKTVTGYNAAGAVDASIVSGDSISVTKVLFTYKAGTDGNTYKISFRVTSAAGVKLEEDFVFSVVEY